MAPILNSIPKAYFDRFMPRPRDGFSSANLRNNFMALASGDFLPCRAISSLVIETHDVGSNAAAAALYSGTGVTVTAEKTNQQEGIACIKAVVDITGNRQILRATLSEAKDLSNFIKLGVWARCDAVSSAIQFIIRDGSGNESYWNITTDGTANTWKQVFLTLASPDANNGTPAVLTNVVSYGYKGLDASATYLFDEITGFIWAMKVWIEPSYISNYFYPIYGTSGRIKFDGGFSPTITAPVTNPRIDLISLKPDGTLRLTAGSEVAAPDYDDIPATPEGDISLYAIYIPTTATKIVEYHYKDVYTTDGYIYADLRPQVFLLSSGANAALSNLASVAINTSLISDTDDTDDLGSQAKRWANPQIIGLGRKNLVINGCGIINQRTAAYTLVKDVYGISPDRFYGMATGTAVSTGTLTFNSSSLTLGTTGSVIKFSGVTLTGTGILYLRHRIEAKDAMWLRSKKASFQVKVYHDVGSNINYTIYIRHANAIDNFSAVTAEADSGALSVATGTATTLKLENVLMNTNCRNGIEIEIKVECGAITTKNFEFTEMQLENGTKATEVEFRHFDAELALCERYYQKSYLYAVAPGTASTEVGAFGAPVAYNNSQNQGFQFHRRMRAAPTVTLYDYQGTSGNMKRINDNAYIAATATGISEAGINYISCANGGGYMIGNWVAESEL